MHTHVIRLAFLAALALAFVLGLPQAGRAIDFDTDLRSSSTGAFRLGLDAAEWLTFNNAIQFYAGSNVSIGPSHTDPVARLEVEGAVRLNTTSTQPTCTATLSGTLWFTQVGVGNQDTLEICKINISSYDWVTIF